MIITFASCDMLSGNETTTNVLNTYEIKNITFIDKRADVTVVSGTPSPCYVYSGSEVTGNDSIRIIKIFGSQEQPICVGSSGTIEHKQSLWFRTPGQKLLRFYNEYDSTGYLDTTIIIK
jgi:hypothetical protein